MIGRWGKGYPFPKVSDIVVAITFEWSRCHSQQNLTYLANFQGEKFLQKNILPHQLYNSFSCQYWLDFRTATALPFLQQQKGRKLALILHTKKAFFSICSYIRNLSSSFFFHPSTRYPIQQSCSRCCFSLTQMCAYSVGQKMKIAVINLWGCDHLDVLGFS